MLLRSEARVGLIVFAAIVVLIGVYWFLGGYSLGASTYPVYAIFTDARTLDKGADVRMAGVKIGLVKGIRLTRRSHARVDMWIWKDSDIPADSVARITTGGFIGDNYIEIVPGSSKKLLKSGDRVQAAEMVQFHQIMTDVAGVLKELRKSAAGINQVLGDKEVMGSVKETVTELKSAAQSASELIESAKGVVGRASPEIHRALANVAQAAGDAARISREIEQLVAKDARPNIRRVLSEAGEAVANLRSSTADAKEVLASFKAAAASANEALAKVSSVASQASEMMEVLDQASRGIKSLATDEQLQQNLRKTAANTAEASEQARQLLTSLNQRFGRVSSGVTPVQKSAIPEYGTSVNALWNTDRGNYRVDANYTFAGRNDAFYRAGLYNLGERTGLNLQAGKTLDQWAAFRYGLYASRLGLGLDARLGDRFLLSADVFRPNDPELELRGVLGLSEGFGLYGGVLDLFDPDRRDVLVGVRYQK